MTELNNKYLDQEEMEDRTLPPQKMEPKTLEQIHFVLSEQTNPSITEEDTEN